MTNPLTDLHAILDASASHVGGPDPLTAVEDEDGLVHLVNPAGVAMISMSRPAYDAFLARGAALAPALTPTETP